MKKRYTLLIILLLIFIQTIFGNNDKYRLTYHDNPSTTIVIALDENLESDEDNMASCDKKWGLYKPYVTTTSIKIGWNNGNDTKGRYTIRWSGASKGYKNLYAKRSHTIKGLKPGKKYYFKITKTCSGGGKTILSKAVWTKKASSCSEKWKLNQPEITKTGLKISWNQGSIKGKYKVIWSGPTNGSKYVGSNRQYTINGKSLRAGKKYNISVVKTCSGGKTTKKVTIDLAKIPTARCLPRPATGLNGWISKSDGSTIDASIGFANHNRCAEPWGLYEYDYDFFVREILNGKEIEWKGNASKNGEKGRIIKNLKPNTEYLFWVRVNRDHWNSWNGNSSDSEKFHFKTPPYNCYTPNLKLDYRNKNAAQVSWNSVPGAKSYTIQINNSSDFNKVEEFIFYDTKASTTHLVSGWLYSLHVLSNCHNGARSGPSNLIVLSAENFGKDITVEYSSSKLQKSIVYPNPNQGNFKIKFGDDGKLIKSVTIHDMHGKLILHKEYNTELKEAEYNLSNKIKSGIYKIQIHTQNGVEYKTLLIE